jgi:uncharacterized delta-60 repeat protein
MKTFGISVLGAALAISSGVGVAQSAFTVDPEFHPFITRTAGRLNSLSVQDGGGIYVAGLFNAIDGIPRNGIARLNAAGGLDPSFSAELSGRSIEITGAPVQPDGKLVVAGVFSSPNSEGRGEIVRLNPDGSRDEGFRPSWPSNQIPIQLLLQPDGKIVVAGSAEGRTSTILRFNADGSPDPSFSLVEVQASPALSGMLLQPDGRILIWGYFTKVNAEERAGLVRLNVDGTPDSTFHSSLQNSHPEYPWISIASVTLLPEGKLLVGGDLRRGSVRLNSDGSVDVLFPSGLSGPVLVQSDGNLVVTHYLGGIYRLTKGGYADETFESNLESARAWVVLKDRKVLVEHESQIKRLNSDGTLDDSFVPTALGVAGSVGEILQQSDSKLVFTGEFSHVIGIPRRGVARLNGDGTVDPSFVPSPELPTFALDFGFDITDLGRVRYQPADGKLIVVALASLLRLNADGTRDSGFVAAIHDVINDVAVRRSDGKLLLLLQGRLEASGFRSSVIRLNGDGSLDSNFTWQVGLTNASSIALQKDEKLLVSDSGSVGSRIVRVNVDGSIDRSFASAVLDSQLGTMRNILIQPDGKIVVIFRLGVVRLNPDGTWDQSFGSSPSEATWVYEHLDGGVLTSENKLILFGDINYFNVNCLFANCESANLISLTPDGQLEGRGSQLERNIFTSSYSRTRAVVLLPEGRALVAGRIARDNSPSQSEIIRLRPTPVVNSPSLSEESFSFSIGGEPGWTYHIETSTDLLNWTSLREVPSSGTVTQAREAVTSGEASRFYRTVLHF